MACTSLTLPYCALRPNDAVKWHPESQDDLKGNIPELRLRSYILKYSKPL